MKGKFQAFMLFIIAVFQTTYIGMTINDSEIAVVCFALNCILAWIYVSLIFENKGPIIK